MSRGDRGARSDDGRARTRKVAEAADAGRQELRAGRSFLRRRGGRLLLLFTGVLLPLWGFAELADEVHEAEAFGFGQYCVLQRLARIHALRHTPHVMAFSKEIQCFDRVRRRQ